MNVGFDAGYGSDYFTQAKREQMLKNGVIKNPLDTKQNQEDDKKNKKSTPQNCETCKHRKYKDASNEAVSFKSAAHISPSAAYATVRAHEGEHVSNAYNKAKMGGGEVVSAHVAIHTDICPECGRTYVSGGTTYTQIRYNESNPYSANTKSLDAAYLKGSYFDSSV